MRITYRNRNKYYALFKETHFPKCFCLFVYFEMFLWFSEGRKREKEVEWELRCNFCGLFCHILSHLPTIILNILYFSLYNILYMHGIWRSRSMMLLNGYLKTFTSHWINPKLKEHLFMCFFVFCIFLSEVFKNFTHFFFRYLLPY